MFDAAIKRENNALALIARDCFDYSILVVAGSKEKWMLLWLN